MNKQNVKITYQLIFKILLFVGGLSFIIEYILHFFKLSLISSSTLDFADGARSSGRSFMGALFLYCILSFQKFDGPSKNAKRFRTYFLVAHSLFSFFILNLLTLQDYNGIRIPVVKNNFLWTAYALITWYFLVWIFWFLQKYEKTK